MKGDERLDIRLLGQLEIYFEGRRLAFPTRHAGFLIALLALGGTMRREIAAARLWSDRGEEQARASLRQTIYHIQKVFLAVGASELVADRDSVGLPQGRFTSDANTLLHCLENKPVAAAKAYRGTLLGDVGSVSPGFQDWLTAERAAFAEKVSAGMRAAAETYRTAGDWLSLETVSGTALLIDPYDETALRHRMEALANTDRRPTALALFDAFRKDLKVSLQIEPDGATTALRDALAERSDETITTRKERANAPKQASFRERRGVSLLVIEPAKQSQDPEEFSDTLSHARSLLAATLRDETAQIMEPAGAGLIAIFGASGDVERHAEAAMLTAKALAKTAGDTLKLAVVSGDIVEPVTPNANDVSPQTVAHLAGEATGLLQTAPPGRIAVSAKADFRLSARQDDTPFVARQTELDMLAASLTIAARGQAQIVGLVGEAGIGKSVLLQRFLTSLKDETVFHIDGYDREALRSFGAVARLLASSLCETGKPDAADIEAAKEAGRIRPVLVPVLLDLFGLPGASEAVDAVAEDRRRLIFELAASLILSAAERNTTVVAIEDAHWLDPDSAEFLDRLIGEISHENLMIVVTFRPDHRASWIGRSSFRLVRLAPFQRDEADALIAPWLDGLSNASRDLVLNRAGGNPFFLVETARALASGVGGEDGQVPATIRDVLNAHIHRLEPDGRRVLQCAAVLGIVAADADIGTLAGIDETRLDTVLARLRQEELLVRAGFGRSARHRFRHALLHDAVYSSIPKSDARSLHGAAFVQARTDKGIDPSIVALHARRSEDWPQAHAWSLRAGDRFAQLSSYALAREAYTQAIDAFERLPTERQESETRLKLALRLRPVLVPLGYYSETCRELDLAETLATSLNDRTAHVAVLISKSYLFSTHGRLRDAILLAQRAADITDAKAQTSFEAKLAEGQARSLMGDWNGTVAILKPTLSFWEDNPHERFGHTGTRSIWCHGHLSNALCLNGQFDAARAHAERAFDLATETKRPLDMIFALHRLGRVHLAEGKPEDALTLLEDAVKRADDIDAPIFRSWFACDAVPALLAVGRGDDAGVLLNRQLEAAEQLNLQQFHGWLRLRKADLLMAKRQLREGRHEAEAALLRAREIGDLALEPSALATLARAETNGRNDDLDAARAMAAQRGIVIEAIP